MADSYKTYNPASLTQLERAVRPQTISIILRGSDRVFDPATNQFVDNISRQTTTIPYGQQTATRRMTQKGGAGLVYEFMYPPTQVSFDNIGYEIIEIPRPLLAPIVEKKSQQNNRVAFEFLVAKQFDGMVQSIDEELQLLQFFVNSGLPVSFENFDKRLNSGYWYIAEFSVQSTRTNPSGQLTAAQCSIGLIEYVEIENKFITLPKLTYTNTKKTPSGGGGNGGAKERPSTTDWENVVQLNTDYENAAAKAEERAAARNEKNFSNRKYGTKASTKNGNTATKQSVAPSRPAIVPTATPKPAQGPVKPNILQSIWSNNLTSKTVKKVSQ